MQIVFLHRREDTKAPLHTSVVIITDIILNHIDQFLFAGKAPAVIAFSLQNSPEALHRSVVNTLGHTGHALSHASFLQFVVKGPIGILKSSITMK